MTDPKTVLAEQFKAKAIEVVKRFSAKLKTYEGDLPVPPEAIDSGLNFLIVPFDATIVIENCIMGSFEYWDLIKDRDEQGLIKMSEKQVEQYDPSTCPIPVELITSFVKIKDGKKRNLSEIFHYILEFALEKRAEILGAEFEEYLWESLGDLIKLCIQYAHHRRFPKLNEEGVSKYTVKFAPGLSVKKEAETWGIELGDSVSPLP